MLEEDAWYPRDLVGLEARMAADNGLGAPAGLAVGKVVDVIDGAQSLLKIRLSDTYLASLSEGAADAADHVEKTALVPFVEQLVPDIDLDEGYLTLDPPGGLIPGLG